MNNFINRYGLYTTWLIATLGMLFSLYFSEIKNMEPCHLCWYQRIALFPLFFILGLATWFGEKRIALYLLPQTVIGLLLALYQILIQTVPGWNPIDLCGSGPSCSEKHTVFGFITIPMLSAIGFVIITLLLFLLTRKEDPTPPIKQTY